MDPSFITSAEWSQVGTLLKFLWGFLLFVVAFALTMLLAHALLPSLLSSGHVPDELIDRVRKGRPLLYLLGLTALVIAALFMVAVVSQSDVLGRLYARLWI